MPAVGALGVITVLLAFPLIAVLLVPFLAWSYRRHGLLRPGHLLGFLAGSAYLVAVWTFTIFPLPDIDPAWCAVNSPAPQLRPLQFISEVRATSAAALLTDPALAQVALNIALFLPLGVLLTLTTRASVLVAAAAGLALSLAVELTQLTGNWGIYPCNYRVFDVDDLIANTLGALLGALVTAVVLRRRPPHPAQAPPTVPVTDAGVTASIGSGRRLLGMLADVTVVAVTGQTATFLLLLRDPDGPALPPWVDALVSDVVPAVLWLLVVPVLARGATIGQVATAVRPVGPDAAPPSGRQVAARFGTGSGGLFLLSALGDLVPGLNALALALAVLSAVAVWRSPLHRGLSGWAAGLTYVDARSTTGQVTAALDRDDGQRLRRMSTAVLSLAGVSYLVLAVVAATSGISAFLGAAVTLVLVGSLGLSVLGVVVFLVTNGVVMLRRERRSLGNLLSLLTGVLALIVVLGCIGGLVSDSRWQVVAAVAVLASTGQVAFLLVAFVTYGVVYGRAPARPGVDAVVVLGSGLLGSRVPPLLAARLDRAAEVYTREHDRGGHPVLICSGGRGPGEDLPEATAMATYLHDKGIPPADVLEEVQSRNTADNMRLSWALVRDHGARRPVAVTSDYHAFRAAQVSTELGISTQVIGARTAGYYYPSAVLREFIGTLARRPLPYVVTNLLLTALAAGVAYLTTA